MCCTDFDNDMEESGEYRKWPVLKERAAERKLMAWRGEIE